MLAVIAGYALTNQAWPKWTDKLLKAIVLILSVVLFSAAVVAGLEVKSVTKHLGEYDSIFPYVVFFLVAAAIWVGAFFKNAYGTGSIYLLGGSCADLGLV